MAAFGVLLVVQALIFDGDRLERWHLRGPVFVLGAVLIFAIVIRGSTLSLGGFAGIPLLGSVKVPSLGLIVAGPLAVVFSAFADKDTRLLEVVVFGVVMTLICGLLFKELLNLPIPFDPAGLIPGSHQPRLRRAEIGNRAGVHRHQKPVRPLRPPRWISLPTS